MLSRLGVFLCTLALAAQDFLVQPYLQLGDFPKQAKEERLVLLFHTADENGPYSVQIKSAGAREWTKPARATSRRIAVKLIDPHRVWTATLNKLKPGEEFDYRVLKGAQAVFEARGRARTAAGQPHRFVVFGDCGAGSPAQKAVAYQVHQAKPDFAFITGDIVYSRGLISEYRQRYFPIYNAGQASPDTGAPLLRSTVFIAAPGNHDMSPNLRANPDGMAYFYYWSQPLNGPLAAPGPNTPVPDTDPESQKQFLENAGPAYPRMANFSFDYGDAHWTVLDSNRYVDWRDPALRNWVENDLKTARKAAWRIVAFHHPGMSSSKTHFQEQHMRLLSELFERSGVDLVLAGHVHNYQRSYPLSFKAAKNAPAQGAIDGDWALDKNYDGKTNTKPKGVIYLVTGAGGANLYDPPQQDDPSSWQPFTVKFVSQVHSFTQVDATPSQLTLKQIDQNGAEVDAFVVTR
jgi:hypothetical protein